MKKFIFIIILVLVLVMCFACDNKPGQNLNNNEYFMDITINEDDLTCKQRFVFHNTIKEDLEEVKFHLYANAYRADAANKAYSDELVNYGGIEISENKVDNKEADYVLSEDKDIMTVRIPEMPLNEVIEVYMEYTVDMPECDLRLGKYNNTYNIGNFYPILAKYENDKWREDEYTKVGDPFYSDISNYIVNITAPAEMKIACTGNIESNNTSDGNQILKVKADNVRDFAISGSEDFNVLTKKADKTEVYYYYLNDEEADKTINTAVNALKLFSDAFGKYPYESYSVVETPFAYGGMEYPTLVYISASENDKENVVVHETAHQWWAGMVGNDSINESYIDEGLATFCSSYYYLLDGNENKFKQEQDKYNKNYQNFIKLKQMNAPDYVPKMNLSLREYTSNEYNSICYDKASVMFKTVYDIMGKKKFEKSLRLFFKNNQFDIAKSEDLYNAFNEVSGKDMGKFFDAWIEGNTQTFSFD